MVSLQISYPVAPNVKGRPLVWLYKVDLGKGRLISIRELGLRLDLPKSSILKAIRDSGLVAGTYTQEFVAILAAVRAKSKAYRERHPPAYICPQCKGAGRIPLEPAKV